MIQGRAGAHVASLKMLSLFRFVLTKHSKDKPMHVRYVILSECSILSGKRARAGSDAKLPYSLDSCEQGVWSPSPFFSLSLTYQSLAHPTYNPEIGCGVRIHFPCIVERRQTSTLNQLQQLVR